MGARSQAEIHDTVMKKSYDENIEKALYLNNMVYFGAIPKGNTRIESFESPYVKKRIPGFIQDVLKSDIKPGSKVTISFGDSMLDMAREQMTEIDFNFNISGSWHFHMQEVAEALAHIVNSKYVVEHVIIGTLGGNPLLSMQDVDITIRKSVLCLNVIRKLFPLAKVIVYGLPPTVSAHLIEKHIEFESAIIGWVFGDKNSIMVPLNRGFGKNMFISDSNTSADGTHFNKSGAIKCNDCFRRAKKQNPIKGFIIDGRK